MRELCTSLFRKGNKTILLLLFGLLLISIGISAYLAYTLRNLRERIDKSSPVDEAVVLLNMDKCVPIDSVPITIKSPGTYCLTKDFETDETPIVIKSNNVRIDLAGHRLQGPGTPDSKAIGVAWDSQSDISVSNGTIAGFFYGIRGRAPHEKISLGPESAASDINVHNLVLLDNSFRGILVDAARVMIKGNLIQNTGGTTIYDDAYSMGIEVIGPGCLVQGNWILETYPVGVGEGVAVSLSDNNNGCQVIENYISNESLPFPGRSFAFWVAVENSDILITNNYFHGFTYPYGGASKDKSTVIAGNVFSGMECSLSDYPDTYDEYPYTSMNHFIFEVDGCASNDVATFLPLAEQGDPRAMFRLGVIVDEPCETRSWWERAAALGHKESIRLLEKYKDRFEQAGCK